MEDSKDLCLCELSLLICTILVIKIEHFQILIHLKIHIMKINNIFLLKITIFSKTTKFSETHNRNSHFFTHFSNGWLTRRQLHPHSHFDIQAALMY